MSVILNETFLKNSPKGVENREIIEILFEFKEIVLAMVNPYIDHKAHFEDMHCIEESIQIAFGFEPNRDYHRFWEWGYCSCPSLDNSDVWGLAIKYYSAACVVHSPIL